MSLPCRLCGTTTASYCHQRVLQQFEVDYYLCPRCDLIQTEQPYWLEQAYSSAISSLDTGAVARNVSCMRLTVSLGFFLGIPATTRCLDWGAGHGVYVRMMRDAGWDFSWADKYGANLFARGFEGKPNLHYQLLTAFEVFEHLVDVRDELTTLFQKQPEYLLVSTLLHTRPNTDWWYFVPETGQHVALYGRKTMQEIGNMFGYQVLCANAYTLFVKNGKKLSALQRLLIPWVLRSWKLANGAGTLITASGLYKSLTQADHLALKAATASPETK